MTRPLPVTADMIIENAKVLTMDRSRPRAQAVALRKNRILAVGTREEIAKFSDASTSKIDAKGGTVLPGFIESHLHIFSGGVQLKRLSLAGFEGFDQIAAAIRQRAEQEPGHCVLMVEQAHYTIFGESCQITRHLLDKILPDRPILLMGGDHHTAWANSIALEKSGLLHGKTMPPGNEVVMGKDGLASGELREFMAFAPVAALSDTGGRENLGLATGRAPATPPSTHERVIDLAFLKDGYDYAAANGFTSLHTMDGDPYQLDLMAKLDKNYGLPVRTRVPFRVLPGMDLNEFSCAQELRERYKSDRLKTDFVKLFMDGVIESTTAFMLEDYCGHPGLKGEALFSQDDFNAIATTADRLGFQIAVHAIGDAAVRRTLDGYEAARRTNGKRDSRHRVEHIEALHLDDLHRFCELGVIASMQPTHAPGGIYPLEPLASLIGPERMKTACAWQTIRNTGARIAFSSDWPVAPISPLLSLKTAMTRQHLQGMPDQRQSLYDTLAGYTLEGAYAEFSEQEKGKLADGYLADLVILSGDIEKTSPDDIDTLEIAATICDGQFTYSQASLK